MSVLGLRRTLAAAGAAALVLASAGHGDLARYGPPERVGTITSPVIPEVSGFVASHSLPGGWWAVNDSGNAPQLHAVGARGRLVASVTVKGATNRDWEDLAAGPAPRGGRALYIADIGDNDRVRDDLVVYRVPEPRPNARATAKAEAFPFRYPDGRHDAEALAVDSRSGTISIITKEFQARVYRFPRPLRPGRRVVLERVRGGGAAQIAPLAFVTGATVSPGGTRIAVRTYLEALELERGRGRPFDTRFSGVERVRLPLERQGEVIAYTRDGLALVTTSEQTPAPIWRLTRLD